MKTIQQQTTQTIPGLASMKLPPSLFEQLKTCRPKPMKILHSLAAGLLSATSILAWWVAFALLFIGAGPVLAGDVFVTNKNSNTIGEYTSTGETVNAALITGLNFPTDVAVSGGFLYVTSAGAGTIGKYTLTGGTVNAALVTGLNGPADVVESGGNLFVANAFSGTIGEYTTSGVTVNATLITGLSTPQDLVVSGDNLFVANLGSNTIGQYTTSGVTVNAALVTGLNGPVGIAVSAGNLFVSNSSNNTIGEYTTSGATVNPSLITGLNDPQAIAVSGGNLYVANFGNNTIGKYTTSGATVNAALVTGLGGADGLIVGPDSTPTPTQAATLTVLADLGTLPNQDKGRSSTNFGVIRASDGNFYGITTFGGSANFGTIFKVTPTGTITALVNFTGPNGTYPLGALIQASDGNLYGTTSGGGGDANGHPFATHYGTVFKVTLDGTLTTIFTFTYDAMADRFPNGVSPQAALVQGTDGNLYGTTGGGGTDSSQTNNDDGTIFKMSTTGTLLMVATVHGSSVGEPQNPRAPLIQGSDGNFYGTSPNGGNTTYGGGTVFRCTPGGVVTVLHSFSDPEGRDPEGGVVQGSDGNFYGTTEAGGGSSSGSLGVVYRVTPAGGFTVLHTFTGTAPDGQQPFGEMILARDGNFYGTTSGGGAGGLGSIFQLTPAGVYTTVYSFPNNGTSGFGITGYQPKGTLLEGSDGNFYGTTTGGNASNGGTVFRLNISPNGVQEKTLGNIATRLPTGTGDNVLIAGFIVTGNNPKKVMVRGIGPSLPLSGALADPTLELHQGDTTVATNGDWKINDQTHQSQEAEIRATTIPPTNDLESAIVATLNPGNYTAILAGKNGNTGIGVVEAYDLDQAADSRLANISTRGFIDTGDNALIGGFISGPNTTVVVRAIGPSLTQFGIKNALADPMLELRDANGVVVRSNNDWQDTQQTEIQNTGLAPSDIHESALIQALTSGNYTAIVRGAGNTTGVAVIEAYNLQ
jgi:uncharacterized repeat protein (TIGR03803 family)